SSNPKTSELALAISQQFGDGEAANRYLAVLKDSKASVEDRNTALRSLAGKKWPELEVELPNLWTDSVVRIEAIRALAAYSNYGLGYRLLDLYQDFSPEEKLEVVQAMASRPSYGTILTEALKREALPKSDIPAYVARQLRRVVGNGFVETWGPIDDLGINKEVALSEYKSLLTQEALLRADVALGRTIFQRSCGACHQMYGVGGMLGPDLTGSNRTNLDYILSNMLDPSAEIQDDYKMTVITTRDGRTYAGNIASENDRQITLRIAGQDNVILNRSEVQSSETTPKSMMPEGLLQTLDDQEVIDLVGYLQTLEQVEL
ncbi:MAG: c-type cytochrome, partial [Saprospiraceae bacterium]|nr:c-type cytochrome [Saprospiraceae bacterium]